MEEAERFVLPSGMEVEAAGRGPPDLALISRRIKETVRLLDTFKVSRTHAQTVLLLRAIVSRSFLHDDDYYSSTESAFIGCMLVLRV